MRNIPWRNGQGDVVSEYVDAFRARGLRVGLYYSVWDNTQGTGNGTVTRAQIDYVKTQLTELLTNYGPIPHPGDRRLVLEDGPQGDAVPGDPRAGEVAAADCLLTDHTHLHDPWDVDVASFEEPKGAFAPADNTYPATQGQKINAAAATTGSGRRASAA